MIVRTAVSSEMLNKDTRNECLEESKSGGGDEGVGVGVYRNVLSVDELHVGESGSHVCRETTLKATPIKVPDFLPPHRPIRRMVAGCKAKREVALREVAWEDMTEARHF
jgi:hypothetical protein